MSNMQLTRTTVRLQKPLQLAAKRKAQELDISFQTLVQRALESYLAEVSKMKARDLTITGKHMGVELDNLIREDLYAD